MNDTRIRVILADDHAVVRAGIRQILEHSGDIVVVAEAEHGEAAQKLAAELQPDVAVLDIQMSRISGIEAARWIKAHVPGVGVLILTAYNEDPYVLAVLRAGANGYVLKTASPEELIQAVHDVRDGKVALSAAISPEIMKQASGSHRDFGVEKLSDREMDVLRLAAKGYTNKAIALQLSISDRTVQGHLAHIYDKLQAASRTEAVMRAVACGWISHDVGTVSDE